MATTISTYNHTTQLFMSGQCPVASTYKVELLNNSATFNATHTAKTSVDSAGSYEVYGYGWTQGGMTLANVACTTVATNAAKFDADDLAVTLSGGNLGPVYKYLIYNATLAGGVPLFFVTLNAALTVTDGNVFGITFNADGIAKMIVSA